MCLPASSNLYNDLYAHKLTLSKRTTSTSPDTLKDHLILCTKIITPDFKYFALLTN